MLKTCIFINTSTAVFSNNYRSFLFRYIGRHSPHPPGGR